jgi:outer membrane protein assembly factor BamB
LSATLPSPKLYDALSGALVWQRTLPTQDVQDCGVAGISGTMQYDKALNALFLAAGNGGGAPNHAVLYRLDVATGNITGHVDVTPTLQPGEDNDAHSGVTLANGRIYVGTGSDCEGTASGKYVSWRGRVVSVDPAGMPC